MSNSSLVSYVKLSPCNSGQRTHAIDRITPHVVVGQLSVETIGACFDHASVQASCNYGIGSDGRVMLCVEENKRSWCSSNSANDQRAVTIECASDKTHPYAINSTVYNKLIELCVDICRRNGKSKLLWLGGKGSTVADKAACEGYTPKSDEMILTAHRFYANKACPGDYVYSRLGAIAAEVTKRLGGDFEIPNRYKVRISWDNAASQLGAYTKLENAKDNCPYGYHVFDSENGKIVYSPDPTDVHKLTAKQLTGTEAQKIAMVAPIYQEVMKETGMLASVGLAQFCLESGYGTTDLAQNANNMHGMKCSLSGNTWANSVWDGKSKYGKYSPEVYNGVTQMVYSEFRKYPSIYKSVQDRAAYFIGAWLDSAKTKHRYPNVNMIKDAETQVKLLKSGGYATDPNYVSKLLNIINRFSLTQYDKGINPPVWNGGYVTPTPAPQPTPTPAPAPTPVTPTKTMYRVQVGVFSKASARDKHIKKIKKKLDFNCFYEQVGGLYYTYCGSFGDRNVAVQRVSKLKSKGFDAFIKVVKI